MVRSGGKRSNTRTLFARGFRKRGAEHTSTYLTVFKVGEYVDIKANSAIQQGMPFKYYHGRTGKIFNVSRTAIGVEVNKKVGNRVIPKRIHVRVEHVKKSSCTDAFKRRVRATDAKRREARANGEKITTGKRQPKGPKAEMTIDGSKVEYLEPVPYEFIC